MDALGEHECAHMRASQTLAENSTNKKQPKKGVKWGINYNFSKKTTIIFAAKTVLY